MAIVFEWELGKESTWIDFLKWYGIDLGRLTEDELLAEVEHAQPVAETGDLARAELARREALEA